MQNENLRPCSYFFTFLIFLLSSITLYSQTASITEGCSPLEVQFFAPAGSSSFFWDFKDNATSTLQDPMNTFIDPGTYEVEFSESPGSAIIGTVTITVLPKPILDISATPTTGCAPLNVQFESLSTIDPAITVNNYAWVFGDGTTASNNSSPNRIYGAAGTYTVSLNIETNFEGCNVTKIFPDLITVSTSPTVSFETDPDPPTSCTAPFTVAFTNTSPNPSALDFEWDFGNGETFTGPNPTPQDYPTEGVFEVTLTGTDAFGCGNTTTEIITIGTPIANFIIPDTVCVNDTILVQNLSTPGINQWNFGPGATPQTSTAADPGEIIFTTVGQQNISLSVTTASNCMADTTISIYVEQADASYTRDPLYTCVEPLVVSFNPNSTEAIEWQWAYGNGDSSFVENPVYEFYNDDQTIYSINGELLFITELTVTNPSGCKASFQDTVIIHEPNALFFPDRVKGCAPLNVTFTDSSTSKENIILWEWDFGDGTTASSNTVENMSHVYTTPGEYEVQLIITNAAGCIDTSYLLPIEVGDQIAVDFEVDKTEICIGDSVRFTNLTATQEIDAFHYHTDNGRSFHCYDTDSLTWVFAQETGPMDVTFTVEKNGCFSSLTKQDLIQVNGPVAHIDYLVDCANPYDISFESESMDATNISWEFGDSSTSLIPNLIHSYDTVGNYWVKLTAENTTNNCPISVDSIQVYVRDIEAAFALDTLLCANTEYVINAAASKDVEATCYRGYTWYFPFHRPITTQENSVGMAFPPGDQSVTLVTRDINGCKDTSQLNVRAFDSFSDFEVDDDRICLPAELNFTSLAQADTTIVNWTWDFGDGGTEMIENATHTYLDNLDLENLQVSLAIEDAIGCVKIDTQFIEIYEPISAILTTPFPNLCVGEEIQFSATDFTAEGSNLSFQWNLANGQMDNGQTTSTIYNQGGSYPVVLSFEEVATGCQSTNTVMVNVQDFPDAAFNSSMDGMNIICYPQNATFSDNSNTNTALNYQWNFDNGQTAFLANPGASFGKGVFDVELIVSTSFGCSDTTTRSYSLIGPEGDFTFDPNNICKGDFINFSLVDTVDISSFSWDFGDGVIEDNVNPTSHQYNFIPPSGLTVATLILRSADDACTLPVEKPIFMHEAIADFIVNDGQDTTSCVNENTFFVNNSTGSDLFEWNFGDNNISNLANPQNSFASPGNYQISLYAEDSQFGCLDTFTRMITIFPLPNTVAIGDSICTETIANLSIENPSSTSNYLWAPSGLISNNNVANATTVSLNTSTSFNVQEIDINGCVNNSQSEVLVIESFPEIEWDTLICESSDIILPVTGNPLFNFSWAPQIPNCINCSFPILMDVQDNVNYTLTATDALGLNCPESISNFEIEVVQADIQIPNVFTPNSDQVNDYFNIVLPDGLTLESVIQEFKIWNRWGELVYNNDRPGTGWDGTQNGKKAPSDVYVYSIKINSLGCTVSEQVGDVTLVR